MNFKIKKALLLLFLVSESILYAQQSIEINANLGFRGNWARTASLDEWLKYSKNYYSFSPGTVMSLEININKFFIRPNLAIYDMVHSHGVFNTVLFHFDSPKTKNIRNTNRATELNLNIGYKLDWKSFSFIYLLGMGKIVLGNQEWERQNNNVNMLVTGGVMSEISMTVLNESFRKNTVVFNTGLGFRYKINDKISAGADFIYQNHLKSMIANSGEYTVKDIFTESTFISFLSGNNILELNVGYKIF